VRNAASRFERDPGVAIAVVAPGSERSAVLAELAFRTPIVCVGCEAAATTRAGTFAFQSSDPSRAADMTAAWILESLRDVEILDSRRIALGLRAHAPRGVTLVEGREPARDPYLFHEPPSQRDGS